MQSRPTLFQPRYLFLLLGVIALVVGGVLAWRATNQPVVLAEPPLGLTPSAEFANADEAADFYRARVRRNPDEVVSWVALAQVLMQQARDTGRETELIPEAQAALEQALRRRPDNYHARLLQASLFNTFHEFEQARDLARQLIAEYPQHAYSYGVLVDALVELGEYDVAVAASDSMLSIRPGIASYSRASYLRELHGDGDGAIAAMRLAADAGMGGQADRAWALYHLGGLYLAANKPDTAAVIFRGILEERPDFAEAEVGLAHVALAKGEADEAIRRLEAARPDAAAELLAEAYAARGDRARADAMLDRVHADLEAAREMGEVVDMEEADFLLDRGQELERSLRMAREQVRRRPGHLHANETYAWALHHNGRSAQAIPYIERAMRLNTGDAMVHHRAAQIYRAAGRPADAARHARLALDAYLHVESPTAAAEARTLLAALEGATPVQATRAAR